MRHTAWVALDAQATASVASSPTSPTPARASTCNDSKAVPDRFLLLLSSNGAARRFCRVVWRKPHQIGVKFERSFAEAANPTRTSSADEKAAPAPSEAAEPAATA